MTYEFSSVELAAIADAVSAVGQISDTELGKYRPVYDLIYDILTNEGTFFDQPVEGLEENVWIWVGGAREVNSGEGYSAYYIREYTRSQYEQRYGITLSDTDLNIASNTIASNFIADILTGTTPTIEALGLIDAAPIAGTIFDEVYSSNYAGWSGTLLFPFLGIDSYYRDWIINDEPVAEFKPLGGTYDLISAAAATIPLSNNTLDVMYNFYQNFGIPGTFSAVQIAAELAGETDAFFNQFYQTGQYDFSANIGSDLFSAGSKSANYVVGTLLDDTYSPDQTQNKAVNGTGGKDVINAGQGNDVIFAAAGDDLIDADEGNDTIDSGQGNDLIMSGAGDDKIIVGEGEDVILDGSSNDRLYIRSSLFGGTPVNGEDRLIPLLGGIASYVTLQDFGGTPLVDVEFFYDANSNGNTEYWFSSHLVKTLATPFGEVIVVGQNLFDEYSLDPFAIVYEMNGSDLEIYIYKDKSVIPPFMGDPVEEPLTKNIHISKQATAKVTLVDYQEGQFGITLEGPHEIATINVDGTSNVDGDVLELHNSFISGLTNNGNLNETLGTLTEKAPITDNQTGEPTEIVIKTGAEDDEFIGDESDEVIEGQAGDDTIEGNGGDDIIDGGIGDDIISGGSGDNQLAGGPGSDVFIGGLGQDHIEGGAGNDIVDYSASETAVLVDFSNNLATGGDADGDTLVNIEGVIGTDAADTFIGSAENEEFYGNDGDDNIEGNGGNDRIDGGLGADTIDGGDGFDEVSYASSDEGVTVDLINQLATGGNALGDQLTNIEGVIGSAFTDTLIGSDLENTFKGGAGDDIIFGAGGNDRIEGGSGADMLDGGSGADTLDYTGSAAAITIDLAAASLTGGDATGDQISGFENIIASEHNDTLKGDAGTNFIDAGFGDDTVMVTAGNDTLLGGFGNDTLDFAEADAGVIVDLATAAFSGSLADGLEAFAFENIGGTSFDDQITGSLYGNVLSGGSGDDVLSGGGGDDTIDGGAGSGDRAQFSGNQTDYKITHYSGGAIRIEDQRPDSPDGTDIITGIELIEFADGIVELGDLTLQNAAPVALADSGGILLEDTSITITSADLLANDLDYDADTLTIIAVANAPDGTAELLPNGDIEFTPNKDFFGPTYFDYTVSDGISAPQTARVTLEVTGVNDNPFAIDDLTLQIYSDTPTTLSGKDITSNDFEFDGDDLTIISVAAVTGGTAVLTPEGDVQFTPTGAVGETAAFSYVVEDGAGFTSTAFVQSIMQESLGLTANDDQFATAENLELVITKAALFSNDINEGSLPPKITGLSGEVNGTAAFNLAGDILFTPDANFFGTASFIYHTENGEGGEDTAMVTITVEEDLTNTPPEASDDAGFTFPEDTAILIPASSLLANDTDTDNDTLSITEVSGAVNGNVILLPNGDIEFTPENEYTGPASFTYTVADGNGGIDTALVNLIVTPVNDAPVADDDAGINVIEDTIATINAALLLANDTDAENDTLTITAVQNPINGSVTLLPGGNIEFTPDADYNGPASFTYTVNDGNGGESQATANLIVGSVNDAPIAGDDSGLSAVEDSAQTFSAGLLLLNDSDVDNDTLLITAVSGAINGSVTLLPGGNIEFTPDADYNGPASFTYTVSDGNGGIGAATANLIVQSVNDSPTNITLSSIDVEENSAGGTIVGTLSVEDVDQGDSAAFTITGGTGLDKFLINGNTLEVAENADLDYETQPAYTLEISAEDSGGLSTTQTFNINLLDLEEGGIIEGTPFSETIEGTSGDDIILGLGGNDEINAGAGSDTLVGGSGADTLDGGDGIDTVNYSGSTSGVVILLTTFLFRPYGIGLGGEATGDRLVNIENIIGSDFSDTLIGNSEANTLEGGAGNDYLIGAAGADQFVFRQGYGTDSILDFNTSTAVSETITIDIDGIENYGDLTPLISPFGLFQSSTRIDFGDGDRLTLLGVRPEDLNADHFDFV